MLHDGKERMDVVANSLIDKILENYYFNDSLYNDVIEMFGVKDMKFIEVWDCGEESEFTKYGQKR